MRKVRILIVDDHAAIRQALATLLARSSEWELCGEAVTAKEAIDMARQLQPDVILLDINVKG